MLHVDFRERSGASLDMMQIQKPKKGVVFNIVHSDQSAYMLELPFDCTGQECVDKMCDLMGIVEKDYFGLQFKDRTSGCNIWINSRLQVRNQLKTKPPYWLNFTVKYYTDPELLLQPSTITAFFKALKYQIRRGEILIPERKKYIIGAHIAQVDFGDYQDNFNHTLNVVYPQYFPEWTDGIAHLIAREHKKLRGLLKTEAQMLFMLEVYQLDSHGMSYIPAFMSGEVICLAIGAKYIRILDRDRRTCLKKIGYYSLTQVAFGTNFFAFNYQSRDEDNSFVEKKMRVYVKNHMVARSIFRAVTEEQVFFYQNSVQPHVLNHADRRYKRAKRICERVFRKKFETKYYYDIVRTKNEAYRHAWQQLHQFSNSNASVDEPPPVPLYRPVASVALVEEDDANTLSSTTLEQKAEICWGLSSSSCKLAKELLPESQLRLSSSEENLALTAAAVYTPMREAKQEDVEEGEKGDTLLPQPLTQAQGKKLKQLLLKIQDEKLCNVCMDELISSVFCPCGHYVACFRCAQRLDRCPVCRQPIGHVQYVFTK